ncbi:alpha/beta hydrolase [Mycolicibacterium porcinum]|nr:alpha/beta hydrolase [Mycolicibacterium porcinum]
MHRGGSGTPLLLLHGIGAIWRVWTPVLEFLEPHHDVIAPTLRGHGGGLPLDDTIAPSLDALADGVEEDLDRLGLGQVHIVGNSLGGWLAVELARRGRAQSLVLLSPAGAWNSQRRIAFTAKTIGLTVNLSSRCAPYADAVAANPALRWLMMAGQVAHPSRVSPESLAALIRASSQSPAVDPLLRRLPQRSMEPLPADRDYPTRVVWAVHDRVLPFDGFGVPMMARLPGADLVRLDGVGHVPMSDDPAGVARLILQVTGAVDAYPGRAVGGN